MNGLRRLALVLSLVLWPALAHADLKALEAAAEKEGELTWYVAHYGAEYAEELGRGFMKAHPGVKVVVVRSTAQVAYQRLLQDIKNNAAICDVFSSTDVGHYVQLKAQGRLMKYVPETAATIDPQFRDLDPDGMYHTTSAGLVLITYNTQLVKPEEVPKNWTDLLDPKWRRRISVGHPGFSGYVGTWVVLMRKMYGWSYFEKLEKNQPQIGRSINDTVTMLNSGERQVAVGPDATTALSAAKGNPLAMVYPTDGALLMIAPSAIMANARHPNAARLFMEYLYSEEAARINVANYGVSFRPEVAPAPGMKRFSEIKTIRPSIEEIDQGIPQVIEQWRDTFGN